MKEQLKKEIAEIIQSTHEKAKSPETAAEEIMKLMKGQIQELQEAMGSEEFDYPFTDEHYSFITDWINDNI